MWAKRFRRSGFSADNRHGLTWMMISPYILSRWMSRSHRDILSPHLITGHGYFNWFFHWIGHALAIECSVYVWMGNVMCQSRNRLCIRGSFWIILLSHVIRKEGESWPTALHSIFKIKLVWWVDAVSPPPK